MGVVNLPSFGNDPASITASGLDGKVDPLATEFNGGIDNDNIDSAAAIAASKLNLATIAQVMAMSGKIFKLAKGADVASAAGTITLGEDGNYFDITGTAAITSITAKTAGTVVILQFDSTASLVDGSNLKLNSNFVGAAESQIALSSDGTNWFEICRQPELSLSLIKTGTAWQGLHSQGASTNPIYGGGIVQIQYSKISTVVSGTTVIPDDNTIPQNSEGFEVVTLAITPKATANRLLIEFVAWGTISGASNITQIVGAIFQDSTAGALYATATGMEGDQSAGWLVTGKHEMAAGTTSATTFKLFIGPTAANTVNVNGGVTTTRAFGGVDGTYIMITEYVN